MSSPLQVCAIVDAYSTGKYLAATFRQKGFESIHIKTTLKSPPIQDPSYLETDFIETIEDDGNLDRTLAALSKYEVICLLPGWEAAVEVADLLSERLGLPSNGTELSAARRDKYKMTETIKKSGLRSVEHFQSDKLEKILEWVNIMGKYPVVVKPPKSAATDGVKICYAADEVAEAFKAIVGTTNLTGIENQEVLVQSYLQGTEFLIDSVSYAGEHRITEIWQSRKKYQSGAHIYDLEELLPYEGEKQSLLIDYICRVLDALGIKYGPAHSEVMLTADGPVLIEVGARLHGGIDPTPVAKSLGYNHVTATVDAYLDPQAFLRQSQLPYRRKKYVFWVALISELSGTIQAIPGLKEIAKLPSFSSMSINVKPGDLIQKTADLFSSPGGIYLVHEDRNIIEKDYQQIRQLEREEFYQLSS
jgi:biotin carboxylase